MQFKSRSILSFTLVVAVVCSWALLAAANTERCPICGELYGTEIYLLTDKVTGAKVQVCYKCGMSANTCFVCGLPTGDKFTELADGRVLCLRDAATAVTDDEKGIKICRE